MSFAGFRSFGIVTLLGGTFVVGACSSSPAPSGSSADQLGADSTKKELTLADVQRAIHAQGASWTAADTSVSVLSKDERMARFGVPLSTLHQDHMQVIQASELTPDAAATPSAWDWRNVNGKNYVSPILDQGRCGSCVAFSTIGTFETQLNIAAQDTSSPFQLSPQYIFSCGGGECDEGWEVGPAAEFLVKTGAPDDSCMPYTSGAHDDDATCSAACSNVAKRVVKAQSYSAPTSGALHVAKVKAALQKGPVAATMTVYEDFFYYSTGVYKHVTGDVAGGHAVSIIGWDEPGKAWVVRNSWGGGWGNQGFFEIAYTDVSGVGEETYGLKVAPPGPYVDFDGIRDAQVLTGSAQAIQFDSNALGSSKITWSLAKGTTPAITGTSSDGKTATIDTTKVADGVYSLTATAGTVTSEPRIVYVLNGHETGSVTFSTLKQGQTLTGEAEFDIKVASAPVPLNRLDWTWTDSTGAVVVTRSSQNTGAVMQLAWDTTHWPNGKYTLNVMGYAGTQAIPTATASVTIKN